MAEYFEWLDSYTVGIESIDSDHKQLVSLLNRTVHAVSDHQGAEVVRAILDELLDYTVFHFDHEELLMESTGYPKYEEHRAIHNRLVRQLVAFNRDYRNQAIHATVIANFLIEWLLQHILQEDAKYTSHFLQHGIR